MATAWFVHGRGVVAAVGLINVLRARTVAVVGSGGAVGAVVGAAAGVGRQVVRRGQKQRAGGAPRPLCCAGRVNRAAADARSWSRRRRRCSQRRSVNGQRGGAVGRLCKNDA